MLKEKIDPPPLGYIPSVVPHSLSVYLCKCMFACLCVNIYICMHVFVVLFANTYICLCANVCLCVRACICLCVCQDMLISICDGVFTDCDGLSAFGGRHMDA